MNCTDSALASVASATSGSATVENAVPSVSADHPGLDQVLERGARLSVGVVPALRDAIPRARIEIASDSAVRGVATSGWRGRSHSLGIADAVTVLARSAALADAAATLVANAVDVDHPGIRRKPARALDEDSDLGDLPVTVAVPALDAEAIESALDAGAAAALGLKARGAIEGAALTVQGRWRVLEDHGTALHDAGGRAGTLSTRPRECT